MFREKIKGAMNDRGISVKELAAKTKINQCTISSFLVGSRAISNENLDVLVSTLELTLVPKKHFNYERDNAIKDGGATTI